MLKITVGDKRYDLRFTYNKVVLPNGQKAPHDTLVEIYEEFGTNPIANGYALLHPADIGKFRYSLGRKIALKEAVEATNWGLNERREFWAQVMGLVRD